MEKQRSRERKKKQWLTEVENGIIKKQKEKDRGRGRKSVK
jgi:hypothetical protein